MVALVGEARGILQGYGVRRRLIARAVGENDMLASRLDGLQQIEAVRLVKLVELPECQSGCPILGIMHPALLGCGRDLLESFIPVYAVSPEQRIKHTLAVCCKNALPLFVNLGQVADPDEETQEGQMPHALAR